MPFGGLLTLGAIGAAGSIGGGIIGSQGSKSSAKTQADASKYVANLQNDQFNKTQENLAPWLNAGKVSLQTLMTGLEPGGEFSKPYSGTYTPAAPFTAPTLADAENNPGYKFSREAGDLGIEHAASAAGGAFTTGTLGQEAQFNQNLAQNNYQQVYNNMFGAHQQAYNEGLQNFLTNFNAYNTNQTNLFNRVSSLAQTGQTTGTQLGTLGANAVNSIGNTIEGGANATASGQVGSANAWSGALNGISSNAGTVLALKNLMNPSSIEAPRLGSSGAPYAPTSPYGDPYAGYGEG